MKGRLYLGAVGFAVGLGWPMEASGLWGAKQSGPDIAEYVTQKWTRIEKAEAASKGRALEEAIRDLDESFETLRQEVSDSPVVVAAGSVNPQMNQDREPAPLDYATEPRKNDTGPTEEGGYTGALKEIADIVQRGIHRNRRAETEAGPTEEEIWIQALSMRKVVEKQMAGARKPSISDRIADGYTHGMNEIADVLERGVTRKETTYSKNKRELREIQEEFRRKQRELEGKY